MNTFTRAELDAMATSPAEQQALLTFADMLAADPCRFGCSPALYVPEDGDSCHPRRPTLSNVWRFSRARCVRCDEPADSETVRRLQQELREDLAEGAMP